jgi:cell division septum initiation protein DivIVA
VVNSTSKEVVQIVEDAFRHYGVDERRVRAWLDGIRSKIELLESELEQLRDKNAELQHDLYRIRYD